MFVSFALWILEIVWLGFVYRAGVEFLSPPGNPKRERATWGATLATAAAFAIAGSLLGSLSFLNPIYYAGSLLAVGAFVVTFAEYFGLGLSRAMAMSGFHFLGLGAFSVVAWFVR